MALQRYLSGHSDAAPPFTPLVSHFFALDAALDVIEARGLERTWAEAAQRAAFVRERLGAMGFTMMSRAPADSVTGAFYPAGVDSALRRELADRRGIVLADGQDRYEGKGIRFSHMGAVTMEDTRRGIEGIAEVMARLAR